MFKIYPYAKDAYRIQAGYGPCGNVFGIGTNQSNMFLQDVLCCLDDEQPGLMAADADILFVTVKAGRRGPQDPPNYLIRTNFVEFLVRCSIEKYFKSYEVNSEAEAVKLFGERFLSRKCK